MYTDEKKPENLVQVYEVAPSVEALQPKPRRPLWRKMLFVFFVLSSFLLLRGSFTFTCNKTQPFITNEVSTPSFLDELLEGSTGGRRIKFEFPANTEDFKVHQVKQSVLPTRTKVFGKVYAGSSAKAKAIAVYVYVTSSDDANLDKVKFDAKPWGLEFSADVGSITKQWVNVTAWVIVPVSEEYRLKTFQIETRELGISLMPNFKTHVNGTYFETISGEIDSYGHNQEDVLHSPFLSAKTTSGNIYGRFGLGKKLDFESQSGNVGVNITIAPWKDTTGYIKTSTVSGSNKVQFANHVHSRTLMTSHKSATGRIRVGYPEDWQGKFDMYSVTGKLKIVGQGIKIIEKGNDGERRFYKAVKGDGTSKGYFASISGNVDVGVGELNWRH